MAVVSLLNALYASLEQSLQEQDGACKILSPFKDESLE